MSILLFILCSIQLSYFPKVVTIRIELMLSGLQPDALPAELSNQKQGL